MKFSFKTASARYRLLIMAGALAILVVSTVLAPPQHWEALALAIFIAFQVNLPLNLLSGEANLTQAITLALGMLYGPATAGWVAVVGITLGYLARWMRSEGSMQRLWAVFDAGFTIGGQILPLAVTLQIVGWGHGIADQLSGQNAVSLIWPAALAPMLLFALLKTAIFLGDVLLQPTYTAANLLRELSILALIEFLPLPFVLIVVIAFSATPFGALVAVGGLPTILAMLMYAVSKTRVELERRVQDLSTLNKISRVLRSTLDLENLLAVIHQQVTQLLAAECFYVALYDSDESRLWYPLAVKYGQRQHWNPRPLLPDRLTDRVIREGKPIRITPHNRDELSQAGMPSTGETIQGWIGVPLITSERAIGCLAVFSYDSDIEFTTADVNLLTILSGQVSVAIENALLYNQTQRRATQLENLNRIMALITASLESQDVLAQVCQSVASVSGAQRSAIFLLDQPKGRAWLAHSYGFSGEFSEQNEEFPLSHSGRTRCLRTGRPSLNADINSTTIERDLLEALRRESIQAFGDFPLTTPNGQIGILSVYFDAPHTFQADEVELLQTFASQAALAVSNARLYASTDKALTQRVDQLAILEAVGRELAAAISSSRLFDVILDYALKFTRSSWGSLTLYNAQTRMLDMRAHRGYGLERNQFSIDEGLTGITVRTRQVLNVGDVRKHPDYLDLTSGASRSQLCVPLIHEGRVLGVLTLESAEENAYSLSDQGFISQLATQAAVAVVNAELYRETQRRLREQSILYLISTHLVGNPESDSILQTVARSMDAAIQYASVGIYLWDQEQGCYLLRFVNPTSRAECRLPALIPEAKLNSIRPALMNTGPLRIPTEQRGTGALLGNCTHCRVVVLPLVVKQHRLGMVLLHVDKDLGIQEEDLQLLHAIVAQVALALQNALLFQDVTSGRDQLAAVLNSVGEGIIMMESSGRIMLVNEPVLTLTTLTEKDIVGRRLTELPPRALQMLGYTEQDADTLTKTLQQGQALVFPKTTVKIAEAKPERVLERSTAPVWGQGGRAVGWMIVLRDVTEEHQIAETREMITETLVHDLRSPVSAVLGAVEIMVDAFPPDQRDDLIEQAFRVARGGTHRVLGLIESLLDIARLKSGRMELNLSAMDLHAISTATVTELLNQANEIGVILRNEISGQIPAVRADQSKITRVLTNLLDNALKFTPGGGQIIVSANVNDDEDVIVKVSDSGPGIPEDFREKIFDRFTQVPGQRGRRRGSGLGLTFCRLAIEAHGGQIWVEPRPGGGSVFAFTLPLLGPSDN